MSHGQRAGQRADRRFSPTKRLALEGAAGDVAAVEMADYRVTNRPRECALSLAKAQRKRRETGRDTVQLKNAVKLKTTSDQIKKTFKTSDDGAHQRINTLATCVLEASSSEASSSEASCSKASCRESLSKDAPIAFCVQYTPRTAGGSRRQGIRRRAQGQLQSHQFLVVAGVEILPREGG